MFGRDVASSCCLRPRSALAANGGCGAIPFRIFIGGSLGNSSYADPVRWSSHSFLTQTEKSKEHPMSQNDNHGHGGHGGHGDVDLSGFNGDTFTNSPINISFGGHGGHGGHGGDVDLSGFNGDTFTNSPINIFIGGHGGHGARTSTFPDSMATPSPTARSIFRSAATAATATSTFPDSMATPSPTARSIFTSPSLSFITKEDKGISDGRAAPGLLVCTCSLDLGLFRKTNLGFPSVQRTLLRAKASGPAPQSSELARLVEVSAGEGEP